MKIGLFDSGIGGLTVLKEFIKKYPNNEYYYFGDTKNMPYGNKTKKELSNLADNAIKFLMNKKVDIIIIACGTISSNIYNEIKNNYKIEIYDIITPTINYLKKSNYKKIGVLGTEMTVQSQMFKNVNKNIRMTACPNLVPMIEGKMDIDKSQIKTYIDSLGSVDVIVLGCTHYPLVINEEYTNKKIINMGEILVNDIVLPSNKRKICLYFSEINSKLISKVNKIIDNYSIEEVK